MNDIGDEGAEKLAEALRLNRSITNIDFGGNDIHAKGVNAIAQVFKDNSVITSMESLLLICRGTTVYYQLLDLRGNGLDEGAVFIPCSLKVVNEALTTLNLGFNEIRDEGAFAIAQAVKTSEDVRFTSLNFASNFFRKLGQNHINGKPMSRVLVDNGAAVNILPLRIVRRLSKSGERKNKAEALINVDQGQSSVPSKVRGWQADWICPGRRLRAAAHQ
ncbi:hypothetical protein ACH5RR_035724 [Cinchona calisaya]|uniref:Uncharacterized protein n=1 Tax=Cinchona calisaya TaxID=153742 RepID=A0ABD2Y3A7_9GENT